MSLAAARRVASMLPLLYLAATPLGAQDASDEPRCRPDEIDMGTYCAGRPPQARKLKPGATRSTPFRIRSMMPGHVGEAPYREPPKRPEGPADSPAGHGFGVQFGVFAERQTAVSVLRSAAQALDGPFRLAPMSQGNRILWACIHGPFPDKESAAAARNRLHEATRFRDAFVKRLDELELIELEHANTEE